MSLNKTTIEWTDYTWNPVTGCKHGCDYCYARRIAERFKGGKAWPKGFEPTFHPERLKDVGQWRINSGGKIFVGSMCDLFGEWVPAKWVYQVLDAIRGFQLFMKPPVFQFLTKNPARYNEFPFPSNAWLGTTVDRWESWNLKDLADVLTMYDNLKFVSFEPLLSEMCGTVLEHHAWKVGWVIIGAQTGPKAQPPKREWVQEIIDVAHTYKIPLFLKNNLKWPEKIQEFPAMPHRFGFKALSPPEGDKR